MASITTTLVILALVSAEAAKAGDNWQIETVDRTGPGLTSSMKGDKSGNLHVCYVLPQGAALKYAFWDHSVERWFVMDVDTSPNGCSLALDSKQFPHISYADFGTGEGARLRYAHWDGTSWKKEAIPINAQVITAYSSIALDTEDRPSLAFYEYRGRKGTDFKIRLRNVRWNGKSWELRTVDGDEGSGKVNNMTSDSKGHFHLVYANVTAGEMRYAYWDGENWKLEGIETRAQNGGQYAGLSCAVTVDKEDDPHVTYQNAAALQLKYAVRKNGRWSVEVVDRISGITEDFDRSSIVVDEDGIPYIGYYDVGTGVLKLAHKEGQRWVSEIVDAGGVGFTSSMQIVKGVIWLSYADMANGALKVAHRRLRSPQVTQRLESTKSAASTSAPN